MIATAWHVTPRRRSAMHRTFATAALREPQSWADIASFLKDLPVMRFAETGGNSHVAQGHAIFQRHCASCHGDDASGSEDGEVPSLRDQHDWYLLTQLHRLAERDRHSVDENLVQFMQSFDEREMSAVANYLSHLKPLGPRQKR